MTTAFNRVYILEFPNNVQYGRVIDNYAAVNPHNILSSTRNSIRIRTLGNSPKQAITAVLNQGKGRHLCEGKETLQDYELTGIKVLFNRERVPAYHAKNKTAHYRTKSTKLTKKQSSEMHSGVLEFDEMADALAYKFAERAVSNPDYRGTFLEARDDELQKLRRMRVHQISAIYHDHFQ